MEENPEQRLIELLQAAYPNESLKTTELRLIEFRALCDHTITDTERQTRKEKYATDLIPLVKVKPNKSEEKKERGIAEHIAGMDEGYAKSYVLQLIQEYCAKFTVRDSEVQSLLPYTLRPNLERAGRGFLEMVNLSSL